MKKNIVFPDYIMQQQYEELRKFLSKKEAKDKVLQAHKEYYGEASKFYGL